MPFLVAALLGSIVIGAARAAARRWPWLLPPDPPGPRKSHQEAIPLAGLPFAAALAGILMFEGQGSLLPGLLLVAAAGACDDLRKRRHGGLLWWKKGAALLAAAGWSAAQHSGDVAHMVAWTLFVFVTTNALNFLDNTNGVCAGLAVAGLLVAPSAWSLPVAGLAAGFLVWNWPLARVFIGDAGALALGYVLAAHALQIREMGPFAWCAPVVVPLLDFTQVVTARVILGFAPWIGDRRHLTHVLIHAGVPASVLAPAFAAVAYAAGSWLVRLPS